MNVRFHTQTQTNGPGLCGWRAPSNAPASGSPKEPPCQPPSVRDGKEYETHRTSPRTIEPQNQCLPSRHSSEPAHRNPIRGGVRPSNCMASRCRRNSPHLMAIQMSFAMETYSNTGWDLTPMTLGREWRRVPDPR